MTDVNNTSPVDIEALQSRIASLKKISAKTPEQHEEFADLCLTLGMTIHHEGEEYDRVIQLLQDAENTLVSALKQADDYELRRKLGSIYLNLGIVNGDYEDFDVAIDYYGQAIEVLDPLDKQGDGEAKFDVAGLKLNRGTIYLDLGEPEKAFKDLDEAFTAFRAVEKLTDLDTRYYMAKTSIVQGNLAVATGDPVEKIVDHYNRAMRLLVELIDVGHIELEHELATTLMHRCHAIYDDCLTNEEMTDEDRAKKIDEVFVNVGHAINLFQKIVNEGNAEADADLFEALIFKAGICLETDKKQECLDINNEIVDRYGFLADESEPHLRLQFAMALESRGYALIALDNPNDALADFNESVRIREEVFEQEKDDEEIDIVMLSLPLTSAYASRASVWSLLNQNDKARADCQKGLDLIKQCHSEEIDEEMFAEIVEQLEEMMDNC